VKHESFRRLNLLTHFPHIEETFRERGSLLLEPAEVLAHGDFETETRSKAFKVGVIGTRKPSLYGLEVVARLLKELSAYRDWIWVSGGAFGIDAQLHRSALSMGLKTQAWLVGPIDDPNPKTNHELFRQMKITKGCGILVPATLDPSNGHRIQPSSWLERNRWLAADIDALVVVEAHEKSGTWNTTTQAIDFGRDAYLIPGSILSKSSWGINAMISEGYGRPVVSLAELTKSLVVLSQTSSYN